MATTAKKAAPKAAPKSTPKAAVKTAKSSVKRSIDETPKQRIYTIPTGGGIWFKLKQTNITVFDEETQRVRQLRYSPNEMSVWADEQGDNIIREQIIFQNKNLSVPPTKPNLAKYLDLHPDNRANGGKHFQLVNTESNAEAEVADEFVTLDAVMLVREKSIDELLPVAMYLGINVNQKNIEIKRELLLEAKSNPKRFIDMFDNPQVNTRSTIMSAIDFQIVRADGDGLKWFDSGKLIVATPAGQDTLDTATRFCLSERGGTVYEEIERQLSKL